MNRFKDLFVSQTFPVQTCLGFAMLPNFPVQISFQCILLFSKFPIHNCLDFCQFVQVFQYIIAFNFACCPDYLARDPLVSGLKARGCPTRTFAQTVATLIMNCCQSFSHTGILLLFLLLSLNI